MKHTFSLSTKVYSNKDIPNHTDVPLKSVVDVTSCATTISRPQMSLLAAI